MPLDPMIARPMVADFGNTLADIAKTKVADNYRNALIQQDQQQFDWQKQKYADQQAQADAEDQAWEQAYSTKDWGAMARIDPQTTKILWDYEQSQKPAMPDYKVVGDSLLEMPTAAGANPRVAYTAPPKPTAGGKPGFSTPQTGVNPATGKSDSYVVDDYGNVKWLGIEPSSPQDRKAVAALRKEFQGLQTYKDYQTVRPLLRSIESAPDTPSGDIDFIYAVGKILDPGSVVREGEMALVIKAGSLMEQLLGTTRVNLNGKSRFPPARRQQLQSMLANRVDQYKQAYDADFQRYTQYAQGSGYDPFEIVGNGLDAKQAQPARPGQRAEDPALRQRVNQQYYGGQ